jgi:hypothetical protein
MSFAAAAESERVRQTCHSCCPPSQERFGAACDHQPSLYEQWRGTVLCFECYRLELNRQRAERPEAVPSTLPLPPFFSEARQLTSAEIAHRQQMLGHLQRSRANGGGAVV